jgi:hypothetical protein
MKKITLLLMIVLFLSCNSKTTHDVILPGNTIEQTLKQGMTVTDDLNYSGRYFRYCHQDEILRTLKIEKEIRIKEITIDDCPKVDDLALILYSYSVGSETKQEAQWFREINGKWTYTYISSYDDNTLGVEHKELKEKLDNMAADWEKETEEIWW